MKFSQHIQAGKLLNRRGSIAMTQYDRTFFWNYIKKNLLNLFMNTVVMYL